MPGASPQSGMTVTFRAHASRSSFFWLKTDRKSTHSSHLVISYAVFCLKKKKPLPQRAQTSPPLRAAHMPVAAEPTTFRRALDCYVIHAPDSSRPLPLLPQ